MAGGGSPPPATGGLWRYLAGGFASPGGGMLLLRGGGAALRGLLGLPVCSDAGGGLAVRDRTGGERPLVPLALGGLRPLAKGGGRLPLTVPLPLLRGGGTRRPGMPLRGGGDLRGRGEGDVPLPWLGEGEGRVWLPEGEGGDLGTTLAQPTAPPGLHVLPCPFCPFLQTNTKPCVALHVLQLNTPSLSLYVPAGHDLHLLVELL